MNESFVEKTILQTNTPNGIALDIGANHGIYTKLLAKKFAHVYAFEPHPDNLKFLNFKKPNVTVIPKAIGLKNEIIQLFTNVDNPGAHSISDTVANAKQWGHTPDRFIAVESITLDSFCEDKKINFIKCDIEGAENFVFQSAINTLKNNKLKIILEIHQTVNCKELFDFFTKLGYSSYDELMKKTNSYKNDEHYLITNIDI